MNTTSNATNTVDANLYVDNNAGWIQVTRKGNSSSQNNMSESQTTNLVKKHSDKTHSQHYSQTPTVRYNTESRCNASDKCRRYNQTEGSLPDVMKYKGHNKMTQIVYAICPRCGEDNEFDMVVYVPEVKKRKPVKIPELPEGVIATEPLHFDINTGAPIQHVHAESLPVSFAATVSASIGQDELHISSNVPVISASTSVSFTTSPSTAVLPWKQFNVAKLSLDDLSKPQVIMALKAAYYEESLLVVPPASHNRVIRVLELLGLTEYHSVEGRSREDLLQEAESIVQKAEAKK